MLTQETKRKIDSARQILVGKVPDPKAQVEQITIALIYKFMDDMDKEAVELGGKARFFTNGFQKYAWTKLLDQKLGGYERLELYGEAVARMSQNPHIPQLFRDIFKDAFLPYRSPETLTLFLKEINGFTYDHSEDLGDAFEYLLSILGSQGDAGQFRTPRHVIDFITEVVEPKKIDKILDPACGTAGFLISAYKNILKQQKDKPLTPDEKKKLMNNLVGYDISPDMVKLSKVNMYLHGFAEPKIFEYDTLSSDEKWDESFNLIIANPPFMSPKGGIMPHKRFSIQAKKSEILFVDYILDHLSVDGRAGIIVPDGIIANSPNAYKQLRKKLVEQDSLYAVVSLPSGIFLPYSDVKTSILFIDKELAKKTKQVLFIQVKSDGFDLGSTRRTVKTNDLPFALDMIASFKQSILANKNFEVAKKDFDVANVELKSEILASPAISLSGKRYKKEIFIKSEYKSVKLGALVNEYKQKVKQENVPVWSVSNSQGFVVSTEYFGKQVASEDIKNYKRVLENYFAYNPARINVGSIALNENKTTGCVSPMYIVFSIKDKSIIRPRYLLTVLKSKLGIKQVLKYSDGAVRKVLSFQNLSLIDIPLPPIDVQDKILEHFEEISNLINKIANEEERVRKNIEDCWGVKESEVIIEADEMSNDEEGSEEE